MSRTVVVRAFQPEDQTETRSLILAGLAEHWGAIDESLNEDIDDIASSFHGHVFLVAHSTDGAIVGSGGLLVREAGNRGELVRMSVRSDCRRLGIGTLLTIALRDEARSRGLSHLVLETQATWAGARSFYERFGFVRSHYAEGPFGQDAYYRLDLVQL